MKGGDIMTSTGITNAQEQALNAAEQESFIAPGGKSKWDKFQAQQEDIFTQIQEEGMTPEFITAIGDFKKGDHANNMRVLMEILAMISDPGWDSFPITPFGWIALILRQREFEANPQSVNQYLPPDTQKWQPPLDEDDCD